MKKIIYSALLLCASLSFSSCDKRYEELQVNPNEASEAAPLNILHSLVKETWIDPWDDEVKYSQYFVATFALYDHQNYLFGTYGMNYNEILNVDKMCEEADRIGSDEVMAFHPIGKFFKAFYYIKMTDRLGDIPMSKAMQGNSDGNFTPKYDTQKEVYTACLELLEEANSEIAQYSNNIGEDLFFNGDLSKWRKAINTFHLRLLMNLSKRADQMDVASRMQAIVSNPEKYPLMESNDDNMQTTYPGGTIDCYPRYPDVTSMFTQRNAIGERYLDIIRRYEDPRVFIQCSPADSINVGVAGREKMFSSYVGLESGDDMATLNIALTAGKAATMNEDTYITPTGVPTVVLGYPELQFTLAEAAHRGWINGDAEQYYKNGIIADMQFYGVNEADIETFINRPENQYTGANDEGLKMILEQKYVAFWQNSGYQPFFEQRRTGIPEFHVGVGNLNGAIPKRWMYPDSERLNNGDNLTEALERQFGGSDDINNVMWIIK